MSGQRARGQRCGSRFSHGSTQALASSKSNGLANLSEPNSQNPSGAMNFTSGRYPEVHMQFPFTAVPSNIQNPPPSTGMNSNKAKAWPPPSRQKKQNPSRLLLNGLVEQITQLISSEKRKGLGVKPATQGFIDKWLF